VASTQKAHGANKAAFMQKINTTLNDENNTGINCDCDIVNK